MTVSQYQHIDSEQLYFSGTALKLLDYFSFTVQALQSECLDKRRDDLAALLLVKVNNLLANNRDIYKKNSAGGKATTLHKNSLLPVIPNFSYTFW